MKNFALEIFDDGFKFATYYTVRWDESEENETNKFVLKYSRSENHKVYFQQIAALIADMGDRKGARKHYFTRHEDAASALPPKETFEVSGIEIEFFRNPLRLYCTRINDQIVILFNGGLKTSQTVQLSPELLPKFRDAQYFARTIWQAIQDEMILINSATNRITNFDGTENEIIL